jgi:hypothetical protein
MAIILYLPLASLVYSPSSFARPIHTPVSNQVFPRKRLEWTCVHIEQCPHVQLLVTIQLKYVPHSVALISVRVPVYVSLEF